MPDSVLLPANIEKITRRDGAPHSVTKFNPATTALLVIDIQNFYMVEGQISYCANAHSIVPNINELVQSVRNSGAGVIWVRNVTNAEAFQTWSNHYGRMKPAIIAARKRELTEDSEGFKLWHDLDARDDDIWINKTRYSAFIDGASNLAEVLAARYRHIGLLWCRHKYLRRIDRARRDDAELSDRDHRGCLRRQFARSPHGDPQHVLQQFWRRADDRGIHRVSRRRHSGFNPIGPPK